MKQWTGETAAAHINSAPDVFGECGGEPRRIARLYRVLAFAVHPDRAALEGIEVEVAEAATVRLNALHETAVHKSAGAPPTQSAAPHVVGEHGSYLFGDRILIRGDVATYLTDQDGVRIEIAREKQANTAVHTLLEVSKNLAAVGMGAFAPTVLDSGITADRAWVAYRIPEGMHTLREVLAAYPGGLDGRDWSWMARRIWMTLAAAGSAHGALDLDTVLIHPEQHGVQLTGWTGAEAADGPAISQLFDQMLGGATSQQRVFAAAATGLSPDRALREYDLLLRRLYGERRFRPFTLPAGMA